MECVTNSLLTGHGLFQKSNDMARMARSLLQMIIIANPLPLSVPICSFPIINRVVQGANLQTGYKERNMNG
jgi:hypothetical protein